MYRQAIPFQSQSQSQSLSDSVAFAPMANQCMLICRIQPSSRRQKPKYWLTLPVPPIRTRVAEYQTLAAPIPVAPMLVSCKFNQLGLEASTHSKSQSTSAPTSTEPKWHMKPSLQYLDECGVLVPPVPIVLPLQSRSCLDRPPHLIPSTKAYTPSPVDS